MLFVDMVPCWRRPCHVLAWGEGGIFLARGGGQNTFGHWDCLRVNWACFCEYGQIFEAKWDLAGPQEDQG